MRSLMQIYVKGSIEAVELYQRAFHASLSNSVFNSDNTYLHVELSVCDHIIAVSESNDDKKPGNTMQFCFHYGVGQEDEVRNAYQVLEKGAQILHAPGPCFYSPCMADFIDKFGVHWCLFA